MQLSVVKKYFLFLLPLVFGLAACHPPVISSYQKVTPIPEGLWYAQAAANFSIEVEDTGANYQTFIVLRNNDAYPFSNIWLNLLVRTPGEGSFHPLEKINLRLADPEGNWLGKGMGGVWEHKIPLGKKDGLKFPKPGVYEINLMQLMRKDPLPGIMDAGIVVQKL